MLTLISIFNHSRTNDKLYLLQMVVTIYKYTTENDVTKKRENRQKKKTHK